MKKIVLDMSDSEYKKLRVQKQLDGFRDKLWKDWILSKGFSRSNINEGDYIWIATKAMRKLWYNNIGNNLKYIRNEKIKSLRDLAQTKCSGSALIVGAGPSIGLHNHLQVLKDSEYKGTIVVSDKMLPIFLEKGIVPNYVITVDATTHIIPFYKNEYFKKHVNEIKVLLHFTADPTLVKYLRKIKADIYWYIIHSEPIINPDSEVMASIYLTMSKHNPLGLQTLVAGGNVGVCCWAFCWVVIKKNPIMMIGMDMGYPEGTNLEKTYYYSSYIEGFREHKITGMAGTIGTLGNYTKEYNPAWKSYAYTDSVFRGYRDIFYRFLDGMPPDVTTINCTEGGTLYHRRLENMKLVEALKKYRI